MYFYLTEPIIVKDFTPDNIFTALGKIGAFLALARLFIFISLYHEFRFEKNLEKEGSSGVLSISSSKKHDQ
jgi:hypothetical protein